MSVKHYKIRVFGLVQGVSFRYYTQRKAEELGVFGRVKNERDGSVSIEAEGTAAILDQLVQWCYQGPPMAEVSRVEKEESEDIQLYSEFQITY